MRGIDRSNRELSFAVAFTNITATTPLARLAARDIGQRLRLILSDEHGGQFPTFSVNADDPGAMLVFNPTAPEQCTEADVQ